MAQPDRRRGRSTCSAGCAAAWTRRRRDELLERFELDPTKKGRSYSKGNRQKVALVAALASDVELLLLDEPTSGLDPLMESVFQDCVDEFRDAGAPCCCPATSSPRSSGSATGSASSGPAACVETGTLGRAAAPDPHLGHRRAGRARPRARGARRRPRPAWSRATGSRFEVDTGAARRRAGRSCSTAGVRTLTSQPPTLEELFLRHYGDRRRPGPRTDGTADRDRHAAPRASCAATAGMLLWWSVGVALLYWSQAVSVDGLYATQAEFDRAAASMEGNAAFIAMAGPGPGARTPSAAR